ncbi:hypothetical protein C8R43DRAFT_257704 [Mycena crocata]|nr:hypothetical protein C8R43DRAFT_257704 [Mycena crocata]
MSSSDGSLSQHDVNFANTPTHSAPLPSAILPPETSVPPGTLPSVKAVTATGATPHKPSSDNGSEAMYKLVSDIRAQVTLELADAWVEEESSLPFQSHLMATFEREYPNLDVDGWLQTYAGYDNTNKRWKNIPVDPKKEEVLYDPIVTIMQAILRDFGLKEQTENEEVIKRRQVMKTHRLLMPHNVSDAANKALKSEPDISIFGTGPAATKDSKLLSRPSYTQTASLWEVKLEETFGSEEKGQIATYAREALIQQPNRRFVYVPILTGKVIRTVQFDRSGCYYSRRIDYHAEAAFFVKLVILLSSFNEDLLGFDTSIYWERGRRFMRMTPAELYNQTTESWEPNTEEYVFALEDQPMFSRRTIRSRGTVCWIATHDGNQYVVKDYWRADGRAYESRFLKELVGIKGVGQMFTYNDDQESIKAKRGFDVEELMTSDDTRAPVLDRWFTRLVLPKYGDTLEKATSPRQLLYAIQDIVKGHCGGLMERGILHRDISFSNLLLSSYDSKAVIIDWDLSKKMVDLVAQQGTDGDSRTGTRAYQSVKVLNGSPLLGHHDNMDDLESIFYVLYYILYGHDLQGNPLPLSQSVPLTEWNSLNPATTLSNLKSQFIRTPTSAPLTRFPDHDDILADLMEKLQGFFTQRLDTVANAVRLRGTVPFPGYAEDAAKSYYEQFLDVISTAIKALPDVYSEPVAQAPPVPPSPSGSVKRGRTGDEPTPLAKRHAPAQLPRGTASSTEGSRPVRVAEKSYKEASDSEEERSSSPSPSDRKGKGKGKQSDNGAWTPRRR